MKKKIKKIKKIRIVDSIIQGLNEIIEHKQGKKKLKRRHVEMIIKK